MYPLIRSRLAAALAAWHPADGSARPLLGAWRAAWPGALPALLHQHIVPKLEHCLQTAPVHLVGRENSESRLPHYTFEERFFYRLLPLASRARPLSSTCDRVCPVVTAST